MEPGYLLDSNVIIGYLAGRLPASGMKTVSAIVDQAPHISVISQIEVLRYNDTPENEAILAGFISSSVIHSLNNPGGAGSAGRQRAGESTCAAYVRHERVYLSFVR